MSKRIIIAESEKEEIRALYEQSKNPSDVNTYPACVANETSNKNRGGLKKTKTGQYYIEVYIAGLTGFQFYNNGRVLYPDKKTRGNYVCNGYKIIIDGHDTMNQKWENGKWSNDATYPVTNYEKRELQKASNISSNLDAHTLLTIAQIGAAFIPLVGPFISAGIGLADASLYYKEGDTKTAGLIGVFSLLPGMGALASKLGIGKLGSKAMAEIAKKIGIGAKLTAGETQIVNNIAKYRALIQSEITKLGQNAGINVAKQNVKKQLVRQSIKTNVANVTKPILGYGTTYAAYNKGYDYVQRNTPKTKSEKEKLDWDFVKTGFGSSGSKEDNNLLNNAWNNGWRPGTAVPKQFQTALYQKTYNDEAEKIKQLEAEMRASKKK
jgi:hypothetical protein